MVRAHMKQSTEEKKEGHKKKSTTKKKIQETGVWPCKINGCNKEFAREADLKRHQRTTKLHSTPGLCVYCPQCEATFTRTDALRRHQKSRHNGIILEPENRGKEGGDDEPGSGGSASHSRSGTPSRNRTLNASTSTTGASTGAPVPTVLARPDTAGPASGAQSYYRQHTVNPVNPVFVPPRTPQGVLDPSSYQAGTQLPTSATRLHGANWPPAPPWVQDGSNPQQPPPPGSLPYPVSPHGPYYPPGAYYRSANGQPAVAPGHPGHHPLMQGPAGPNGPEPQAADSGAQPPAGSEASNSNIDPSLGNPGAADSDIKDGEHPRPHKVPDATSFADHAGINAAVRKALQAVLAIDPTLNAVIPNAGAIIPPITSGSSPEHQETSSMATNTSQTHMSLQATPPSGSEPPKPESSSQPTFLNESAETPRQQGAEGPGSTTKTNGQVPESSDAGSKLEVGNNDGMRDGDADMDADADGEADVDGEEGMDGQTANAVNGIGTPPHMHPQPMLTEDGEPMLRPDELLNEESLASPPPS